MGASRQKRRSLLESLEARQLLAGPQLIGIQPNEGELIANGVVRDTAPRVLTFRFDQDQQIDPDTLDGIQIVRSGTDGVFGTGDDVTIVPGLVTVGDPNENEVVVRFANSLPDDNYRVNVFGFDDSDNQITGLRNTDGEFFRSRLDGSASQAIDFRLDLGALIEAVVPQPVVRLEDGSLRQNRNEIVVYFNEDPLFVEDETDGSPSTRSAENPRFYQLLLTQETVRTTDDAFYQPTEVVYDAATHTARLFFDTDINELSFENATLSNAQSAEFNALLASEASLVANQGANPNFAAEVAAVRAQITAFRDSFTVPVGGGTFRLRIGTAVDQREDLIVQPRTIDFSGTDAGDILSTSLDVGTFGPDDNLTSVTITEAITPQRFDIQLPGGDDDDGHRRLVQHINAAFGADSQDGISEIPYNFQGVYATTGSVSLMNQIQPVHQRRIREVLDLWSERIGVQFRETATEGITFALGQSDQLDGGLFIPQVDASVRVDPALNNNATAASATSAIVFSNQASFGLTYGEDFTRKAAAAVGLLLGLQGAADLPDESLLSLTPEFLEDSINRTESNDPLNRERVLSEITFEDIDDFMVPFYEPTFPANIDILHGQHIHRPDSTDIDLFRFEIDLRDVDRVGTVTIETFAERLSDASDLDTTVTLFRESRASVTTDFRVGPALEVRIESTADGRRGNGGSITFIESDRANAADDAVRIFAALDSNGVPIPNGIVVDIPRRDTNITSVPVGDIITAINTNPLSNGLFVADLVSGSPNTDVGGRGLSSNPLVLDGGGLEQIARNDNYFSNDSFVTSSLGTGVYYIGVAASGNDKYDPTIPGSGFGGLSQGAYELRVKFEPQVDEVDVLRDRDGVRSGVPGTPVDGDGDGTPGGVDNFWFQTRPENRIVRFDVNGAGLRPEPGAANPTITILSGTGENRIYEFVPTGQSARPGNIAVQFNAGTGFGVSAPANIIASALETAINARTTATGVSASVDGTLLTLNGERDITLSANLTGLTVFGRTMFVDKTAGSNPDGTLANPFERISGTTLANAFGAAEAGDIVRVVGNGGFDQDITTENDNFSYQVGVSEVGGRVLDDGRNLEVPRGVTMMVDAGAIIKFRSARLSVGSSNVQINRTDGALQVLGTPRLVQLSTGYTPGGEVAPTVALLGEANADLTGYDDGSVILTSTRDRAADRAAAGNANAPEPGDWGGLVFRRDVDLSQGRRNLEDEGIFLQTVNHAELRYGGSGDLTIGSVQQTVNPIQLIDLRPSITFNEITQSDDAAISAAPNSFEETTFGSPRFQQAGVFTADYDRVGPEIHNNSLVNNSINGLFVRSQITPTSPTTELIVAGRFDDIDIVHVIAENLIIAGKPGGSITDGARPNLSLVSGQVVPGGTLNPAGGSVQYRMTFVDRDGFESAPTTFANAYTISVTEGTGVRLAGLPTVPALSDYVARRIYRADSISDGVFGEFRFVADLNASTQTFLDRGASSDGVLDVNRVGRRGRLDGSLVIDPGLVVKLQGARIELGHGAQLIAEGTAAQPIVLTSTLDDRFGAGGTFDTNNDNETTIGARNPARGNWAGIYASPNAHVSLDFATIAYGGGISLVEGGQSRGFAALELQQASGRITNSRFEFNEDGMGGSGATGRSGRLAIDPSTIFVRGSQPIIVGNEFVDNHGSIIEIDVNSLTTENVVDLGRQTGPLERLVDLDDNQGPLVRLNRYQNVPGSSIPLSTNSVDQADDRQISGMRIRGGELSTESVWDDTDIVHVLTDSVVVGNLQSQGGLLLKSRANESLVVKLGGSRGQFNTGPGGSTSVAEFGPGTPNSPTIGTGLTATGRNSDTDGRVGGSIQIVGLPGAPVVMTSLKDDTVGAGLGIDGSRFTDTNGDGFGSRPSPNDWRSVLLDQFSNDRNVDLVLERELPTEPSPGRNGTVVNAQVLGELAGDINSGDDVRRLGFEVAGFLSSPEDVDTYSFTGTPGSEVWIDIDRTAFTLDTVIELLDVNGNLLARSDNSFAEIAGTSSITIIDASLTGQVQTLQGRSDRFTDFAVSGLYDDADSTNPRDAGLRVVLPGDPNGDDPRNDYFFRVRSASINADQTGGGTSSGRYEFQLRLREDQEHPGSVVRFADIRYSNYGVHVRGLPGESPLLGEAQENETVAFENGFGGGIGGFFGGTASNDTLQRTALGNDFNAPLNRPQYIGNLLDTKAGVISVAGAINLPGDIDFYQVDLSAVAASGVGSAEFFSTIFDIDYAAGLSRPDTNISVFYDPDGETGAALPRLVLFADNSNVADDLSSPNGEDDLIERLTGGSISTGDPMIGPVSLPAGGSYYVAITEGTVFPEQLSSSFIRREPINSIQRLFEDRVEAPQLDLITGQPIFDTASGPRFPKLFGESALVSAGVVATTLQSDEFGHGSFGNFDGSNRSQNSRSETLYVEPGVTAISTGNVYDNIQQLPVFDVGNLPFTSFDLTSLNWSLADNPQIGAASFVTNPFFGNEFSENTSTTIPHVSVQASMGGDIADFYRIVVTEDNTRVIIDVDEGFNPFQGPEDDDDLPAFPGDFNSVDVDLVIIDATPDFANTFPATPDRILTSDPDDGRFGSVAQGFAFTDDDIIGLSLDPFFDGFLNAGEYFIGILHENTTFAIADDGAITIGNDDVPFSGQYVLHVSQETVAVGGTGAGNESLFFDRDNLIKDDDTLRSVPFDLTGYVAADQPRFYYNYRLDAPSDEVTVRVVSTENPDGLIVQDFSGAGQRSGVWLQDIVDLSPFAGDSNIQIEIRYATVGPIQTGQDGLFIDDMIVGFAERGETIFNADGGATTFTGFGGNTLGEYQLEIRSATDFGRGGLFGAQELFLDFDTNDRHGRQVTLVAPSGSQLVDGDFFEITDGRTTQVFEFNSTGGVTFGRQRIDFLATDSAAQIAQRLRQAINDSSSLNVEAASAGGLDTQTMTGSRVNLFGATGGSLDAYTSFLDAPSGTTALTRTNGQLQIPAVLIDGKGDRNHERVQGQVLIENNTFSDIHAIAVYSEAGDRGVDPEDARQDPTFDGIFGGFFGDGGVFGGDTTVTEQHPFLQLPPVGNPAAGVARNLPTANDSVVGGLMPGVVIRNNTIDQAGLAGVKIEGEARPWVIEPFAPFATEDDPDLPTFLGSSAFIADGSAFAIDAGGTRVVFEFEDIAGAPTAPDLGSGTAGGDGYVDGHVPIFYRHTTGGGYNDVPQSPFERDYGYNAFEVSLAIMQAIQGSILVTNNQSELVRVSLGPSMLRRDGFFEEFGIGPEWFASPAVYIEGASQIYPIGTYAKGGAAPSLTITQLNVAESPQPLARVINNTIYGADGIESNFPQSAAADGNDLIDQATVTHQGRAHTGPYIQTAAIGDQNIAGIAASSDVDFYRVELSVGDRLVVDIDTLPTGPDTIVQLFDANGVRQTLGTSTLANNGFAPDHLNLSGGLVDETVAATPGVTQDDLGLAIGDPARVADDPFVDFTARATGTYFVAVSALGNVDYDPRNVSGRRAGTTGILTGDYQIGIQTYAPRSFVISLDDDNEVGGGNLGSRGSDVIGTTFTITQIPDFAPNTPNYGAALGGVPNTNGNQLTFEFTASLVGTVTPGGNINVPLLADYRTQDIMRAIANAINGVIDPIARVDTAPLPNHEDFNGPDGISGPITRARALALGGADGDNLGIVNLSDPTRRPEIEFPNIPLHYLFRNEADFLPDSAGLRSSEGGFGHSRRENNNSEIIAGNALTDGIGTTELYVLFENIAGITLSPEAIAGGLKLTPDQAKPQFADNADQLIPEVGIWVTGGASPTLLNNALSNLHQSVVGDETSFSGFGQRVLSDPLGDLNVKPQQIVLAGNTFQHDESRNTEIRFDLTWLINPVAPFDVIDTGLSTDAIVGATNVASDSDDFNFTIGNLDPLFINSAGGDFQPADGSDAIDSAVNGVSERAAFATLKAAVGIPPSNILAPTRDVNGVLRVDNPNFATPGGLGATIVKDRGSVERADFVGPTAIAVNPVDNDPRRSDVDGSESIVQRVRGGLTEFQIQLVDTGDSSDPFTGIGIDDRTAVVPEIPGLRLTGANVALFENDQLLLEGIDYTFNYDLTSNLITLTPLAGVWSDDKAYSISLNNRDRTVLVAPDPNEIVDGDQLRVTDSEGGAVVFEFETGYQLLLPETLTLIVPRGNVGGTSLRDGDNFQVTDARGRRLTFEFDQDGFTLSDEILINTPADPVPALPAEFNALIDQFSLNVTNPIQAVGLDVGTSVTTTGTTRQFVITAPAGTRIQSTNAGLSANGQTLSIPIPAVGVPLDDGFDNVEFTLVRTVAGGATTRRTFSFANGGAIANIAAVPVIALDPSPAVTASRLAKAIDGSGLDVQTLITADAPDRVRIGAETNVRVNAAASGLQQASRTLALVVPAPGTAAGGVVDGDSFTLSNGASTQTFEFNTNGVLNDPDAIAVTLNLAIPGGVVTADAVAAATAAAIEGSTLRLNVEVNGSTVFLNLPQAGSAVIDSGTLQVVGVARPVQDGDFVRVSEEASPASNAIQINDLFPAGDLLDVSGAAVDGQIVTIQNGAGDQIRVELFANTDPREPTDGLRLLDITDVRVVNDTTEDIIAEADEIARRLAQLIIEVQTGVNDPNQIVDLGFSPVAQDAFVFLNEADTADPPTVTGSVAGIVLNDEAQFIVRQSFEFELVDAAGDGDGVIPGSVIIPYRLTDSAAVLAARVRDAMNQAAPSINGLGDGTTVSLNGPVEIDIEVDPATGRPIGGANVSVSLGSSLEIRGEAGYTGGSTVQVFGPLLLDLPNLGGFNIVNGSVLTLTNLAGVDTVFQFRLPQGGFAGLAGAVQVPYVTSQSANEIAITLAAAINQANVDMTAVVTANGIISLGRIDQSRVNNRPIGIFAGATGITIQRGIVTDGEVLTIRQGDIEVSYEFENINTNNGVAPGNVEVSFQPTNTPGEIAQALASAISNNLRGLTLAPVAQLDDDGEPDGSVVLNDIAGTQIDVSTAPTLDVVGVPGGANPILISSSFTPQQVKRAMLDAIASVGGLDSSTTLLGEDRGGNELFLENAALIEGLVPNYFLPAVKDRAGNPLEPNRDDRTTQFTILMPEIQLDFGDAPNSVSGLLGRYPSGLDFDGARHIIGAGPTLGRAVDAEADALAVVTADGDDLIINATYSQLPLGVRPLLRSAVLTPVEQGRFAGAELIEIVPPISGNQAVALRDGDTVALTTGTLRAVIEVDTNGIFNEDNYQIRLGSVNLSEDITVQEIAEAVQRAINEAVAAGQLAPASNVEIITLANGNLAVVVNGNDEDGVNFISVTNPNGAFNKGVLTPIEVTVNGTGVIEAWIDFNADGDWNDPGEQIISANRDDLAEPSVFRRTTIGDDGQTIVSFPQIDRNAAQASFDVSEPTTFTFIVTIPDTSPSPRVGVAPETFARFRVSRNGGLSPQGLALSGEVEDYRVPLLPGLPPVINDTNSRPTYTLLEGGRLQATDDTGTLTVTTNDNGLLVGVTDPDLLNPSIPNSPRQAVQVYSGDVGTRPLLDPLGNPINAGTLVVNADGTFDFQAAPDFSGPVTFTVRVSDVVDGRPDLELVSSRQITATINVTPVNDAPTLRPGIPAGQVIVQREIFEDNAAGLNNAATGGPLAIQANDIRENGVVTLRGLIESFYIAGPGTEPAEQELFIQSAGSNLGAFRTSLGGSLQITNGGQTVLYTPPTDINTAGVPDTFTYLVADRLRVPGTPGFASQTVDPGQAGRVEISLRPVNDPPRLMDDGYALAAGVPTLEIPVRGNVANPGILDNDTAGPSNEPQTITLVPGQFTSIVGGQLQSFKETNAGGRIRQIDANTLRYERPVGFRGLDRFTYIVSDSEGAQSTATVVIDVDGTNNAPTFTGINGVAGLTTLTLQERKSDGQFELYDLDAWFNDLDSDDLTYTVTGGDALQYDQMVTGNELRIELRAFAFGTSTLDVTANDGNGGTLTQRINVVIEGSADGPRVAPTAPLLIVTPESVTSITDLNLMFFDPDGDQLSYRVQRLGSILNPTAAQIANHPLIQSISLPPDAPRPVGQVPELIITPKPFVNSSQFADGDVDIEIVALDGQFQNSHLFRFRIDAVESPPVGVADNYNVPIGGRLVITQPTLGLLRNDFDPDLGQTISLLPNTLTQPAFGTVTLNGSTTGTFTYTSDPDNPAMFGQTDTFSYRIVDSTGRQSQPIDVTITFNQSEYQNPIERHDVTADGFVTALDALRIINFINAQGSSTTGGIPVSEIGTTPPDFLDVSGDGRVSSLDALQVINELQRRAVGGRSNAVAEPNVNGRLAGEPLSAPSSVVVGGFQSTATSRFASTVAHATMATANLGDANAVPVIAPVTRATEPTDSRIEDATGSIDMLLTGGVDVQSVGTGTNAAADRVATQLVRHLAASDEDQPDQSARSAAVDHAITTAIDDLFSEY